MSDQQKKQEIQNLFRFIEDCPTAYQTVQTLRQTLKQHGFVELMEHQEWQLCPGQHYFVTRNASSLIAFSIPAQPSKARGYHIVATHGDAPSFKLKPSFERNAPGNYAWVR
ncbi:MAG: hypothetical protein II284_03215 [Clostridia bacterium]|nr:hypothetical protein [Clostridia bacterium]